MDEVYVMLLPRWELYETRRLYAQVSISYIHLELQGQRFINGCFNWMMNQIFTWEMVGNHQTSIKNWLFRVPGSNPVGV